MIPNADMKTTLLTLVCMSLVTVQSVPYTFFPFGTEQQIGPIRDSTVRIGDEESSPAVVIPIGFPFLYGTYSTVYVRMLI